MKIELTHIKVRDLVDEFSDSDENGVTGYHGLLDIRPQYQREYVYTPDKRDAVIDTLMKGFPLNIMYWVKRDDGTFELLDGQQRTISIARFINGQFSVDYQYFHTLPKDIQEEILNYDLTVYQCQGTDSEKLSWFKTINVAGTELTNQELLNAVYAGAWLTDAKRHFSKTGCVAANLSEKYVKGSPIRQELLEKALKWIADSQHIDYQEYMAKNQSSAHATELWRYFQAVINWVENTFPVYRKEMKGLEWGLLYNKYKDENLDPKQLESRIKSLMEDEEVTKRSGIYEYVLSNEERFLNLRAFTDKEIVFYLIGGSTKEMMQNDDISFISDLIAEDDLTQNRTKYKVIYLKDALDISGFENYMSSMGYAKTKDLALNVSF